jgi:hypothetical protein
MGKSRTPAGSPDEDRTQVGLTAYGRAGGWEVSVDEALSGIEKRFLQIEGPSVYLYFEIPSPGILQELARFLEPPESLEGEQRERLELGTFNGVAVDLLRDDEHADRFFFCIIAKGSGSVRITVAGDDLKALSMAVIQVRDELKA